MFILGKRTVSEMQAGWVVGCEAVPPHLAWRTIYCILHCITLTGRMTGKNAQITGKLIHHYAANVGKFHKKKERTQ
jgi:hypothetical protein